MSLFTVQNTAQKLLKIQATQKIKARSGFRLNRFYLSLCLASLLMKPFIYNEYFEHSPWLLAIKWGFFLMVVWLLSGLLIKGRHAVSQQIKNYFNKRGEIN